MIQYKIIIKNYTAKFSRPRMSPLLLFRAHAWRFLKGYALLAVHRTFMYVYIFVVMLIHQHYLIPLEMCMIASACIFTASQKLFNTSLSNKQWKSESPYSEPYAYVRMPSVANVTRLINSWLRELLAALNYKFLLK